MNIDRAADMEKGKKRGAGGRHEIVHFNVQKEVHLSENDIEKCFWFECACEESCLWKCSNELLDAKQVIKDLRSARFAGKQ